ncbi:DNA-binding CsgD family transcriptional regulator [Kitasatospora sp. MAP12-15]|uniref:helix-turn-helix transcriptional regulator n=1 Tax=unclassified Kitasatospora TaxID=2633591 RepID=UPI002472F86C|nr:AAA family ATPase [Kitasatospora sp. MAP12-44]MDH6108369.1 DNA-binding CsgD family transcriptional regulator [Kitasatospora sp. MAP12-44]
MTESAPFVGRSEEQTAVALAYARAAGGRAQVLLVSGEAGLGKTRLIEELAVLVSATTGAAQLRIGESVPLSGTTLAYGPFVAALRDRADWLFADDGAADLLTARQRLFERMLGLLGELSSQSPLVLVLEDLHWADESTRELLAFLAVRLREQRVMIVATIREEDLSRDARRWLAELARRPRVTRLRLVGLADAEVADLVGALLPPDADQARLAAVVSAAGGNPLYAQELVRAGPHWPPASIAEVVLARVAGVEPPVREVIDQISVTDSGMSHELLAATVPLPEPVLLAATRQAVALRLLVAIGDGYALPHALTRQILYTDLLPGERRRLHRRFAGALAEREGSDPALLARHWQLADCPDRAAAAALVAARLAVAARAYPEADRLYALVVELAQWLAQWGPGVWEEAAYAASLAGDPGRATGYVARALADLASDVSSAPRETAAGSGDARVCGRARLLERLGRYQWESGDPRAAVAATEQAVALLDDVPPCALQARVLAATATGHMLLGEPDQALPLTQRALLVAEQVGAVSEHAHALTTLGILRAQRGELVAGLDALRAAFALAHRAGNVEDVVRAASSHMYLLCTAGRFTEALDVARDGRRAARSLGAPPTLTAVLDNNTAAVLVATGRWTEADHLLAGLVGESAPNVTRYLHLLQMELAVARDERQRAGELAAALAGSPDDPRLIGPLHACLAEQALSAGDLTLAAEEVLRGLAVLSKGTLPEEEIRLLADGSRVAADLALLPDPMRPRDLAIGWGPAADTFTDRARAIVDQHGTEPLVAALGALVHAERARQDRTDDRATWRAVADSWQVADQPYREAYARYREAETAIRAGRRDQAERALAACAGLARHLAARPLLRLAHHLAERGRLTDHTGSTGPPDAVRARFDLTERESQVLALLSNGESNRQIARSLFISDRTVAVHVSHILDKLGVRNRTEAALVHSSPRLTKERDVQHQQ